MTFKERYDQSFAATEEKEKDVSEEIMRLRSELETAIKSGVDEETLIGYEERIRELEREQGGSVQKEVEVEKEEGEVVVQEKAPVAREKTEERLDYDGKIARLREEIHIAEKAHNEAQVLSLEDSLRSLEQEKRKALEQLDYEAFRSVAVAEFEETQRRVKEQTHLVKEVENTDEAKYKDRLAQLRQKEGEMAEAGIFLSKYWGKSLEDHEQAKKAFAQDLERAQSLNDLGRKIETWGGIPEKGGKFSTYGDFFKQMQEVFAAPPGSERRRRLQLISLNPSVKERILELYAKEETGLQQEYPKVLKEEAELRAINEAVHSPAFQSGTRFLFWSLIPRNNDLLGLFQKHNIAYDTAEARKTAAPIGAALKLNAVLHKKKELENIMPKSESGSLLVASEEGYGDLKEYSNPQEGELGLESDSTPDFSAEEESEDQREEEEEEVREHHPVTAEAVMKVAGIETQRTVAELARDIRICQEIKPVVASWKFRLFPFLYNRERILLRKLNIPYFSFKERRNIEALLDEKMASDNAEKEALLSRSNSRILVG